MADEAQTVPFDRFNQVNNRLQEAVTRASTLETEIAALKQTVKDRDAAAAAATSRLERVQVLARHGFADPELADLAEYAYGRTPEQGRPSLETWMTTIRADPAQAPLALRPHLQGQGNGAQQQGQGTQQQAGQQQGAAGAQGQQQQGQGAQQQAGQQQAAAGAQGQTGQPFPNGSTGTVVHPHAGQVFTADQIAKMTDAEFLRALPALTAGKPGLERSPVIQAFVASGNQNPAQGGGPAGGARNNS